MGLIEEIHELKEWIKKSNECIKFIEAFKSDKQIPLNNSIPVIFYHVFD
jgi:hypothetical protein